MGSSLPIVNRVPTLVKIKVHVAGNLADAFFMSLTNGANDANVTSINGSTAFLKQKCIVQFLLLLYDKISPIKETRLT